MEGLTGLVTTCLLGLDISNKHVSAWPESQITCDSSFGRAQNYRHVTGPCHPVRRWEQNRRKKQLNKGLCWGRVQQTCLFLRRIKFFAPMSPKIWLMLIQDINLHTCVLRGLTCFFFAPVESNIFFTPNYLDTITTYQLETRIEMLPKGDTEVMQKWYRGDIEVMRSKNHSDKNLFSSRRKKTFFISS